MKTNGASDIKDHVSPESVQLVLMAEANANIVTHHRSPP